MKRSESASNIAVQQQQLTNVGECLYRSDFSGRYYAIFRRGGKQIKQSLKTSDKELAKRKLEELRQKVGRLDTKRASETLFADLADRWLQTLEGTMKSASFLRRQVSVKALKPYFRTTIRVVDKLKIEQWASTRSKEVSARTFNIDRETLTQVLDYAMKHGLVLENLAKAVRRRKQGKAQIIIPTKEQFKAMLDQLRSERQAAESANFCEFLAYSGCRLAEATAVKWGDINFKSKTFLITGGEVGTKNHEVRTVPLFPPLDRLLLRMHQALKKKEQQSSERIFTIANARQSIDTACRNAKLPHFTHHSLRHFFCSNAIEAGIDFKVIAGWLGHKDGGVLVARTYGHLRDEHSTLMAKRMTFDASDEAAPAKT